MALAKYPSSANTHPPSPRSERSTSIGDQRLGQEINNNGFIILCTLPNDLVLVLQVDVFLVRKHDGVPAADVAGAVYVIGALPGILQDKINYVSWYLNLLNKDCTCEPEYIGHFLDHLRRRWLPL